MKHIMISGMLLLALSFTINISTAYPNDLTGDTTEENFEEIAPYESTRGGYPMKVPPMGWWK